MEGAVPLMVAINLEADVLVFPIMISPYLCSVSRSAVERDKSKERLEERGLPHFFHTSSFFAVGLSLDGSTNSPGRLASFLFFSTTCF